MTSIDETSQRAAAEDCETAGHDLTAVYELGSRVPVRLVCPRCGRSWHVSDTPPHGGEVVGYVVVATTSSQPETARWMTPARRDTIAAAETDRAFWNDGQHLQGAGLRLAKLVLLPEDEPPTG